MATERIGVPVRMTKVANMPARSSCFGIGDFGPHQ